MSYWEILGISPTEDLSIIKKAYSKAIKKYHPEDDPDGFQNVRNAYKAAEAYAKRRSTRSDSYDEIYNYSDPSEINTYYDKYELDKETEYKSEKELINSAFSDSVLFDIKVEQNENYTMNKENDAPDGNFFHSASERINYSFNELLNEKDPKKEESIQCILDKFIQGYRFNRKSKSYWKNFFTMAEFKSFQTDSEFTDRFLKLFYENNLFSAKIYNKVFVPTFVEWSYHWGGSEYEIKLKALSVPHDDSERIIGIVAIVLSISIALINILYNFYTKQKDDTDIFTNSNDIIINENNQDIEFDKEVQRLMNDPITRVTLYIMDDREYDSNEEAFKELSIDEIEYNELVKIYKEGGYDALIEYMDHRN